MVVRRAQERESHEESEWTGLRSGSQPASQKWQELDVLAWLSLLEPTQERYNSSIFSLAQLNRRRSYRVRVACRYISHAINRMQSNLIYQLSAKRQPRYKDGRFAMHAPSQQCSHSSRPQVPRDRNHQRKGPFSPRLSCHVICPAPRSAITLCFLPVVISRLHPIDVERRLSKVDLQ